jgi:hypothetical protein
MSEYNHFVLDMSQYNHFWFRHVSVQPLCFRHVSVQPLFLGMSQYNHFVLGMCQYNHFVLGVSQYNHFVLGMFQYNHFVLPQFPNGLACDRARIFAATSRRLTAWPWHSQRSTTALIAELLRSATRLNFVPIFCLINNTSPDRKAVKLDGVRRIINSAYLIF